MDTEWYKRVRRTDPETSVEAAKSVKAERQYEAILNALATAGQPLAAEQIADLSEILNHVMIGKRMIELERAGCVVKTDLKHTNRSGRSALKYALTYNLAP